MWRSTFVPETIFKRSIRLKQTDRTRWTIQTHSDELSWARRHERNSLSLTRWAYLARSVSTTLSRKKRFRFSLKINYFSSKTIRIGYDSWILTSFSWPISSHFDFPLGQYRALDSETSTTTSMRFLLSNAHAWTSVILAGKRDSRCHSTVCGGNKLSKVSSFIILLSGEGLTSFSINNRTDVFGEKE